MKEAAQDIHECRLACPALPDNADLRISVEFKLHLFERGCAFFFIFDANFVKP